MNKDEQIKKLEEELSSAVSEIIILGEDSGYHVSFGVKMIVDGHITLEEYCNSMPWVHSHTAERVVKEMKELIEYRHFNLTQEQIDEAIVSLAERNKERKKATPAASLRELLNKKTKSSFD